MKRAVSFFALLLVLPFSLAAQDRGLPPGRGLAPGAPGADAHWLSAAKNGFGTSTTARSKIWFTLTGGMLSEVYYPTIDKPNVQSLQLIVVTPDGKIETESDDTTNASTLL